MSLVSAPFWHATGTISLEDRYRAARLDVLIHTCCSRTSNDPLLTVSALGRVWPTLGPDSSFVSCDHGVGYCSSRSSVRRAAHRGD